MVPIIAGLLLLWAAAVLLRGFVRASPAAMARRMRQGGGFVALCLGLLMLVRGRIDFALGLGALGFWLTTGQGIPAWDRFRSRVGPRSSRPGATSRVRSAAVEMELDHATGAMRGLVLAGPFAGATLDQLGKEQLLALLAFCAAGDPEGLRLLEAYLDRRVPGWRATAQGQGDARQTAGAGRAGGRTVGTTMSEEQACQLLGVPKGASRDEVARAHRALMKKYHPDHGGSTDLAARVNEAKDVLMRRHAS